MNINNFNFIQDIEFSRKSMNKTMRRYTKMSIYLKLLKNK